MSSVLIKHDSGLGDHLRCHGIVREYCKKYDRVGLFCRPQNRVSVEFMYRDIRNLMVHLAENNSAEEHFWKQNQSGSQEERYDTLVKAEVFDAESSVYTEKQYYKRAQVPFEKKWESFYIERDFVREQALIKQVNPPEHFIFVHEQKGHLINPDLLPSTLTPIRPVEDFAKPIFDNCGIIEKATEVHVIESSFFFLIDLLPYNNPNQKLFLHRYARPNPQWINSVPHKPWTILN